VPAVGGEDGSSADDGYGAMAREKTDVVTKKLVLSQLCLRGTSFYLQNPHSCFVGRKTHQPQ
jgi:hypothetical protein